MTAPETLNGAPGRQPLPGASFGTAVRRFYNKYAQFKGRASRSEFWWVYLYLFLVNLVLSIPVYGWLVSGDAIATPTDADPSAVTYTLPDPGAFTVIAMVLSVIFWLANIVPALALIWRRFHDGNFPGPLFFLALIPGVGGLLLLIFMVMPSKPEGARYDV